MKEKNRRIFLLDYIDESKIHYLEVKKKEHVLIELLEKIDKSNFNSFQLAREEFIKRESLMSTGIGFGIAFPHIRSKNMLNLTVNIALIKEGVEWESFDDKPVRIVILITVPEKKYPEYLTIIAKLSMIFRDKKNREIILNEKDEKGVYSEFIILCNQLEI